MTFQEAEQRYAQLQRDWQAGRLTPAQFQEAVAALRVLSPEGTWWTIRSQDGAWLAWDGTNWLEAIPPHRLDAPAFAAAPSAEPQKKGRWWRTCLILLLVVVCGLGALGGAGYWAVRSGRLSAMQISARLSGTGELKIVNTSDGALTAHLNQLEAGEGDIGLLSERIESFDIGGFGGLSPGRYQLDFESESNSPPDSTCTFSLDRNDVYQFVAVPQGIAVVRQGSAVQDGAEMDVARSSLCRQ
jgi:hypothetical protein